MHEIDKIVEKIINSNETKIILKKAYSDFNASVYPKRNEVFSCFKFCKPSNTKVIIFGQDPYYLKGVADGLAFSSKKQKAPASLKNIFKELKRSYPNIEIQTNNLYQWAKQGVLLLNTCLTVEENKPLSHKNIGWNTFIKKIICVFNEYTEKLIFVLWGKEAQKFKIFINQEKHYILESSHPSPFSFNKGFWGNNHFYKINQILKSDNKKEIDWNLIIE